MIIRWRPDHIKVTGHRRVGESRASGRLLLPAGISTNPANYYEFILKKRQPGIMSRCQTRVIRIQKSDSSPNNTGDINAPDPARREDHEHAITRGVTLLTGDPKVAIRKLSGPMILAMLLMSLYNLADAVWVAGLGPGSLAAVGFITPLFMVFIGLGNGLGAGVSSAVARYIGAGNRREAENAGMHGILIGMVFAAVLTLPLVLFAEPIAALLGAGEVTPIAAEYGRIVFGGAAFILFNTIAYAILRGEGDTKRTMYAMAASSILNVILDPVLIYGAGWGIAGAAIATVISMALVSLVILYWFVVKQDTYLSISPKIFVPEREMSVDILRVGLPASAEFFLMSVLGVMINIVLVMVATIDAVAVYTSGWRLVMFAIIPVIAISTTLISVIGAAYGARNFEHLKTAHAYAVRLGTLISVVMAAGIFLFAPQIAFLFAYTESMASLAPRIALFMQAITVLLLFIPIGMMSLSVFQGTGRGVISLVINILRTIAFVAVFVYVLGIYLGYGENGVWAGIIIGNIIGSLVAYFWARAFISRLVAVTRE
ncbi:MAG TPA: MATE family efflux transporter [Methanolinea sp.]|nr:MATE family efflux transporter [Methanolinea sp.]HQK56810.1 MATE family efflux transporter [Methanolinea sp.]